MNWVAVDLGVSTIKVSVLDKNNKPVRMTYSMGNYETTLFSSVVVVTEDGNVILGDYASKLGVVNPNLKVYDWLHSSDKALIAKNIFEMIKRASIKHYSDSSIGVVLLYNNIIDPELKSIAETIFSEVKTMPVGEVLKRIISPNSNLMLIADFGESAFRVILQEKEKCLYQTSNNTLGFSSFDMLSLIDCQESQSHSSIEIALLGEMMQHIKILANDGEKVILPCNLSVKGNSFADSFAQKITTFFYQCFEECSNALKVMSKSWDDVNEVIFIGGVAHSNIINSIFAKYMKSYFPIESYNSRYSGFDAQFIASHSALQLSELKEFEGPVVERNGNYVK